MPVTESFAVNSGAFDFCLCHGLGSALPVSRCWVSIRRQSLCNPQRRTAGTWGGRKIRGLFDPYTLVFKSRGAVWFRLRCLVWFFTVVAKICTHGAVNNGAVFLSWNQPCKRLRGDLYSLEQLGFVGEGRRGGHGTSVCSHSGFALCVCSPRAAPLPPSPPCSVLTRPKSLVLGEKCFFFGWVLF